MWKWLQSNLAPALIGCLLSALWGQPSLAACHRTLDRLAGQNSYPGSWVYVCQGSGVNYVKRTRRLIVWRSPNPETSGAYAVRFLDVDRILGHGVNWLSVTTVPLLKQGTQDPETLDVKLASAMALDNQILVELPDIPFPRDAGPGAHDRLQCDGIWRVPEGGVPASMAVRLFVDGRREARFRGLLLREGTRDGLSFEFSDAARITLRGAVQIHPDGQGGWQVSCRFEIEEPDYYGKDHHRTSRFTGRVGAFSRHHCQQSRVDC